jgi:hypothetical protein
MEEYPFKDSDIVSTFGEIPKKFIRELYDLANHMKIIGFSLFGTGE